MCDQSKPINTSTRYYLFHTGSTHDGEQQTVEPFPNGFQMIAGSNSNRNSTLPDPDPNPLGPWPKDSQDERAQRALGFNCLHYAAGDNEPTLMRHQLPDKDFLDSKCTDGLRLELQFPSCWNGQLDGGPSHKSHVAYPDGVSVGNCPEGYDRRLITLLYETIVATDEFAGKPGQFVLANGDPTGFGYHGDFIAAWKDDTLEKALQACNEQVSSGQMKECPVFEMTQDSATCKLEAPLPPAIANEDVKGPMKGLANGLQVAYGPASAPKPGKPAAGGVSNSGGVPASQSDVATASIPSSSAPSDPYISASAKPIFENKKVVKPQAQAPAPTPAPAAASLSPNEQALTTTTQYTQGQEVIEVLHEEIVEPVVITTTIVGGQQGKAKEKRKEHVRRHVHHRHQGGFGR